LTGLAIEGIKLERPGDRIGPMLAPRCFSSRASDRTVVPLSFLASVVPSLSGLAALKRFSTIGCESSIAITYAPEVFGIFSAPVQKSMMCPTALINLQLAALIVFRAAN
jgi:hypothetical protein